MLTLKLDIYFIDYDQFEFLTIDLSKNSMNFNNLPDIYLMDKSSYLSYLPKFVVKFLGVMGEIKPSFSLKILKAEICRPKFPSYLQPSPRFPD